MIKRTINGLSLAPATGAAECNEPGREVSRRPADNLNAPEALTPPGYSNLKYGLERSIAVILLIPCLPIILLLSCLVRATSRIEK